MEGEAKQYGVRQSQSRRQVWSESGQGRQGRFVVALSYNPDRVARLKTIAGHRRVYEYLRRSGICGGIVLGCTGNLLR